MRIERDPSSPKKTAQETARQKRDFINAQGEIIQNTLKETGIPMKVKPGTEIRDAGDFNRKNLGYLAEPSATTITTLAGSEHSPDNPVSLLYVPPKPDSSSLLTDKTAPDKLYADSFFIAEKDRTIPEKVIKHIQPSSPLPLDGIVLHTVDKHLDPALESQRSQTEKRFQDIIEDKTETKRVLADSGIPVQKGIAIKYDQPHLRAYIDFVNSLPPTSEIVIKPNKGMHGEGVLMGNPKNPRFPLVASEHIRNLRTQQEDVIIEERISPPPQPALARLYNENVIKLDPEREKFALLKPEQIDYNFRIIATVGENPEIVDGIIRYAAKNEKPVNVSQGAFFTSVDILEDPDRVNKAYDTAKQAISHIYEQVHQEGDPNNLPLWVGVDVAGNGSNVFEIQYGPEGFEMLGEMAKRPPDSISEKLLPSLAPALEVSSETESEPNLANLRRVSLTSEEQLIQYQSHVRAENWKPAEKALLQIVSAHPDRYEARSVLSHFESLAQKTGDYTTAYQYARSLSETHPDNFAYLIRAERLKNLLKEPPQN